MDYPETIVLADFQKECNQVLDYGCGDAHFTKHLLTKAKRVYGCDIDKDQLLNNEKKYKNIIFGLVNKRNRTSYPDNFFDCITLMGVIEHVANETILIKELYRILTPGGVLYIFTHNKGLFGFLDPSNLKFISPLLHSILYKLVFGEKAYREQFIYKKRQGMYGDFPIEKKWHSHYSLKELEKLTKEYFTIEKKWFFSFFFPLIGFFWMFIKLFFRKEFKILNLFYKIDNKINLGSLSYNIVIKFRSVKKI